MACNCKNKTHQSIHSSKIQPQEWEDVNTIIALDKCGETIIAEKPDTLSPKDREKINTLKTQQKGDKALYNNGEYKETYTSIKIDKKLKEYDNREEVNKKLENYYTKEEADNNISSALENYYTKEQTDNNISSSLEEYYTKEQIDSTLENAVFFDQNNNINTKNNIILGEENKIIAKQTDGQEKKIFNVIDASDWNALNLGSEQVSLLLKTKNRPSVQINEKQNKEDIAFLNDIEEAKQNLQHQIDNVSQNIEKHKEKYTELKEDITLSIENIEEDIKTNAQNIALNSSDIQTLRDDFNAAEHFKGYFKTKDEITEIPGEQGAFAWCAESGKVWVYNHELKTWQESDMLIPDQTVAPYDLSPLMDGKAETGSANQYARGDHRHPSDTNKADKQDLENLSQEVEQQNTQLNTFKQEIESSLDQTNSNIADLETKVNKNQSDIQNNATDIQILREDFNTAEHFKGYFETKNQITEIPGEQGAFAWCAESGLVWIYNHELKTWQETENSIPDQTVAPYDLSPLMDGKATAGTANQYARGDHKHPSDTNKADKTELDNYLSLQGNSQNNKITGDIWINTENKINLNHPATAYLTQEENTQTTILHGGGGGGIDLQTESGNLKHNGINIATVDDIPDTSIYVINGENENNINISARGLQFNAINSINLNTTVGTVNYNQSEIAIKSEIEAEENRAIQAEQSLQKEIETLSENLSDIAATIPIGSDSINITDTITSLNISDTDQHITVDTTGIKIDIDLEINENQLILLNKNGEKIKTLELPQSQIIDNVYINTSNELVIELQTTQGKEQIKVDLTKYIDIYQGGEYITINNENNNTVNLDYQKLTSQLKTDGFVDEDTSKFAQINDTRNWVTTGTLTTGEKIHSGGAIWTNKKTSQEDGLPGTLITSGQIELFHTTPYIDFHSNNSTADYTSRIIETEQGKLNIDAPNGLTWNEESLATKSEVQTVQENLDNLQIGGINYYKYSVQQRNWGINNTNAAEIKYHKDFLEIITDSGANGVSGIYGAEDSVFITENLIGKNVVISFDISGDTSDLTASAYYSKNLGQVAFIPHTPIYPEWNRIYLPIEDFQGGVLRITKVTKDAHYYFRNFQIEIGNKPTDYKLSEYDIQLIVEQKINEQIEAAKSDIYVAKADKSELQNYLPLSGGTIEGDLNIPDKNLRLTGTGNLVFTKDATETEKRAISFLGESDSGQTTSSIDINKQGLAINAPSLNIATTNMLTHNGVEIATKNDIITSSDGDGTKFLSNDGTYKEVKNEKIKYSLNINYSHTIYNDIDSFYNDNSPTILAILEECKNGNMENLDISFMLNIDNGHDLKIPVSFYYGENEEVKAFSISSTPFLLIPFNMEELNIIYTLMIFSSDNILEDDSFISGKTIKLDS